MVAPRKPFVDWKPVFEGLIYVYPRISREKQIFFCVLLRSNEKNANEVRKIFSI